MKTKKTRSIKIQLTESEYQQFKAVSERWDPLAPKALLHGFVLAAIEHGPESLCVVEAVMAQAELGRKYLEGIKNEEQGPKLELVER